MNINTETEENVTEVRSFNSRVNDYDLAPGGHRIAFSIHAPTDEGDVVQITDNPARDRQPRYSPDGEQIAYVSDRSGREEIYITAVDGSSEAHKVTDIDALKFSFRWGPDSKAIAFVTSDDRLMKYDLASQQTTALTTSKYGQLNGEVWSPDGMWLAYPKADATRDTDIYLIPSGGGAEHKVTFDSYSEVNPRFSADGKKLYFQRREGSLDCSAGSIATAQIYVVALERQDSDPDDPEERA